VLFLFIILLLYDIRVVFNEFTIIKFKNCIVYALFQASTPKKNKTCAVRGYYEVSSGYFLPTFRDNLSVASSSVQVGPIGCPETSVRNQHYSLRNDPEQRSQDFMTLRNVADVPKRR
jgi:hypothetical protein